LPTGSNPRSTFARQRPSSIHRGYHRALPQPCPRRTWRAPT
jgi:hypothetical protein